MTSAFLLLLVANLVYATSYVITRLALDDVPPATLALIRLVLGGAVLLPLATRMQTGDDALRLTDARVFWMGALGFAGAFALSHWGLARSSATNAALLIVVEPLTLMALGPVLLGERLTRREVLGAALSVAGAVVVVVNGVPGYTLAILPHWRGDVLLILAGVAYASYSLFGRAVLTAGNATSVTARSVVWGALVMLPLAALEWAAGAIPRLTPTAVVGALYLAVVITAGGYVVWNWALARVEAARAAPFLTVQPVVGAVLGALVLGEPVTGFTVAGGVLIVLGLWLTVTVRR
jgi:drug/metabolite transporter (DMT)-like permease